MTPSSLISMTACAYGLAPADLRSRSRKRQVAEARAVAAYLAYELTGVTYEAIGEELERDKSTVCRIVDFTSGRLTRRDSRLTRRVAEIERMIGAEE